MADLAYDSMAAECICRLIAELQKTKQQVLFALDGRCGAGKTTLAAVLADALDCAVIHMDDFFLRPEQRTAERLAIPGGNVDHERLLSRVLEPLAAGKTAIYRPYSCQSGTMGAPITVEPGQITLVEGSYACHDALWDYYDLHIFMDIDSGEQERRILQREGKERAAVFRERWIPLEEKYFAAQRVAERCEIYLR